MNMFISNLGFDITADDLRKRFEPFGQGSSATIIVDEVTGLSRGFGFVNMESETGAGLAIRKLNGKEMGGRNIAILVAKEKTTRPRRTGW